MFIKNQLVKIIHFFCGKCQVFNSNSTTSIIEKSIIETNSIIGRNNYIFDSKIGNYSYTALNTSIMATEIGEFCSIGKNVNIGTGDHPTNFISTSPFLFSKNNIFQKNINNLDYFDEL